METTAYTQPQFSLPGIRDPQRDYPFENLSVQCGTTPSNFNTSIQRPLARQRVMLSRRVIAYYGLIRDSESLPATYEFVAESAAPKEIGLRWESRGSPIYSAGLDSCAASLTPVAPKSIEIRCQFIILIGALKSGVSSSFSLKSVSIEIRCRFIILARKDEPTSRQEARERRIVGSLKPFRWNPAGNQSRPVEPDQQPEASLAWWVGDHPCEA